MSRENEKDETPPIKGNESEKVKQTSQQALPTNTDEMKSQREQQANNSCKGKNEDSNDSNGSSPLRQSNENPPPRQLSENSSLRQSADTLGQNSSLLQSADTLGQNSSLHQSADTLDQNSSLRQSICQSSLQQRVRHQGGSPDSTAPRSTSSLFDEQPKAFTSPHSRSPPHFSCRAISRPTSSPVVRKPKRRAKKSKSDSSLCRAETIKITVKTAMSSFKPLRLGVKRTTSVDVLKQYIRSRTGLQDPLLVFNGREINDGTATMNSLGVQNESTIWLVIRPVAGNNDREEIASLLRMSQSLSHIRAMIHSMPSVDDFDKSSKTDEYEDMDQFLNKEKEHENLRAKMKLLLERRKKIKMQGKPSDKKSAESYEEIPKDKSVAMKLSAEDHRSEKKPSSRELLEASPSTAKAPDQQPLTRGELSIYFDPPETIRQMKLLSEEMFDPPSTAEELQKIRDEIRNTRCGICRVKLPPAQCEIRCICDQIFCKKHRPQQSHRCSIDQRSIDREHIKKSLPKIIQDEPKSKQR